MSVAQIQAHLQSAATAVLAGEPAEALRYARAAQILMAGIPRISQGATQGRNEVEYLDRAISAAIVQAERALASARGVQATKITRHAPECPSDNACAYQSGAYL